jgi:mRNA interferase RelE/StbE
MAYSIQLTPRAAREYRQLPRNIQERVSRRIDELADEPRPHGAEKLAGHNPLYRVRVGEYRIIYEVRDVDAVIAITLIGHRRDVYRDLDNL